jgi:Ca2+ transporting ATPase
MEFAHTKTCSEITNYFAVDEDVGLSDEQIKRNQEKYGPNGE